MSLEDDPVLGRFFDTPEKKLSGLYVLKSLIFSG